MSSTSALTSSRRCPPKVLWRSMQVSGESKSMYDYIELCVKSILSSASSMSSTTLNLNGSSGTTIDHAFTTFTTPLVVDGAHRRDIPVGNDVYIKCVRCGEPNPANSVKYTQDIYLKSSTFIECVGCFERASK